jgi:RND family efflux transporter MFP subunit
MLRRRALAVGLAGILVGAAAVVLATRASGRGDSSSDIAVARPALSVAVTTPQTETLSTQITTNGTIAAWQEASVGTEANGLRLVTVTVNVGDVVRRGQVLAVFESEMVAAELAQSRAAGAEAEAALAEAGDNAERANGLQTTGALSEQQIRQYVTAERTAKARLEAMQAAAQMQQLRLAQTQVLAPDDGVISARTATVGAVMPAGQELFRLIRRGRLEWRAEVTASDLVKVKPWQVAHVTPAGGEAITGTVRMVAPTIDTGTRNGLVYVDLPAGAPARAGMFARGAFDIQTGQTMTLPQSAVLLRDGFSYVFRVGSDAKVVQTKATVGRRVADRVEITGGIDASARVVVSGGVFLGDGDLVRVVDDPVDGDGGAHATDSAVVSASGGPR